jgi:hypothetical protein
MRSGRRSWPRLNSYALYQGWLDTVLALRAARLTGVFGAKEKQVARQVQLNLELRRPQAGYAAARSML